MSPRRWGGGDRPRGHGRGQSEVLGSILIFALVISLLATIQVTGIPASNEQVELDHNLRVQEDMQDLSGSVLEVATRGSETAISFEFGTRYRSHLLFLNPPPAYGSLQTAPVGQIVVENATADGQTSDYLNGNTHAFETNALEYRPIYNRYRNAPTTVYEYPTLSNRFKRGEQLLNEVRLVDGRRITLVMVSGNLSTQRLSTGPVDIVPMSAPAQPVAVTNASAGPLTIRLPTRLSNATWRAALAEEYVSNGGYIVDQRYDAAAEGPSTLTLRLAAGESYRLRMARVGLNTAAAAEAPRYLVDVTGNNTFVRKGAQQQVVVEVRDRYNNPVSGIPVVANTTNLTDGTITAVSPLGSPTRAVSDEAGRARFIYQAPSTGVAGIEHRSFSLDLPTRSGPAGRVPFTVEVREQTLSGDPSPTGDDEATGSGYPSFTRLEATADNVDTSSASVEQVSFTYNATDDLAIREILLNITAVEDRTQERVGSRGNLPAKGPETVGLDPAVGDSSVDIAGAQRLRLNVTVIDISGNRRTCIGWVEAPDETITMGSASNGGTPFDCSTTRAAEGS